MEQILEHFEIRKYFTVVTGSEMNETRTDKGEVIAETLRRLGAEDSRSDVVMVGDRSYDVIGARENGLLCVGVSYGYGGREELEAAGAAKVCDTPEELKLLAEDPKEEKKRRDRIKKMKPERIPWLTRGESGTGIFAPKEKKAEKKREPIGDYIELQSHLARYFDTKVDLKRNEKGRGKIVISFKSDSELERIVELLDKMDKK